MTTQVTLEVVRIDVPERRSESLEHIGAGGEGGDLPNRVFCIWLLFSGSSPNAGTAGNSVDLVEIYAVHHGHQGDHQGCSCRDLRVKVGRYD